MSETALRLKDELLRLPEEDRRQLANVLWDSLDEPSDVETEAEWDAELERRFTEIETGQAIGVPTRDAIQKLREKHQ